jgi:hypothetical protein
MKDRSLSSFLALLTSGLVFAGCLDRTISGALDDEDDVVVIDDEEDDVGCGEEDDTNDPMPTGACFSDFEPSSFGFPSDAASCDGPQYTRFLPEQGLYLGLVSCGDGTMRFYLAESLASPFFQATDWAGHGQDFCELVRPNFVLPNEDDITTGCAECSTGQNFPLEYVPAYSRGYAGEQFTFIPQTGEWSNQISRVDCGCGL